MIGILSQQSCELREQRKQHEWPNTSREMLGIQVPGHIQCHKERGNKDPARWRRQYSKEVDIALPDKTTRTSDGTFKRMRPSNGNGQALCLPMLEMGGIRSADASTDRHKGGESLFLLRR